MSPSEELEDLAEAAERGSRSVLAHGPIPPSDLGDFDDRIVDTVIDTLLYAYALGADVPALWREVEGLARNVSLLPGTTPDR